MLMVLLRTILMLELGAPPLQRNRRRWGAKHSPPFMVVFVVLMGLCFRGLDGFGSVLVPGQTMDLALAVPLRPSRHSIPTFQGVLS